MKIHRFSEIDLARFAALPPGPALEQALRTYKTGGGSWSYNPVRESTSDIVAASTPLLGEIESVPWKKIEAQITAACRRGDTQVVSNVGVGKVLYDSARQNGWKAIKLPMGRLPIGISESVRYWSDILLVDEIGVFIPFFDHRRGQGLSNSPCRQIVYSMQHVWVRDRHPDIADARLAVIRFPEGKAGRRLRVDFHREADLLSYEELDQRIRTVYETWARILLERPQDARRTGTDRGNPFDF